MHPHGVLRAEDDKNLNSIPNNLINFRKSNMQRIILSLVLVVGTLGAVGFGATTAFFSDTETSTANTFAAGDVDLKIDNESYYNGLFNKGTSWGEKDLDGSTSKFFDFDDLKPGDYGEDTISLHVDTNDAYLCANVKLTSNNENTCNEPEALDDTSCGIDETGAGLGELAKLVEFVWWADDGDNVFESDEKIISEGKLDALGVGGDYALTLADSGKNIWNANEVGGPVNGDETYYIGKAWCFGDIGTKPVTADNGDEDRSPAGNNGGTSAPGEPEDGGLTCNGSFLTNESQTDSLTADIAFSTVQARHNAKFVCKKNCTISEVLTLIPDSGFENPEVDSSSQWNVYNSPAGAWNVAWRGDIPATFGSQTRPNPAKLEIHEGVLGTPFEGDQYAELDTDWGGPFAPGDGEPASVTIYQDIPTVIGKNYRIKFAFAARPNTGASENRLETKWGGNVVHDTGFVADPNGGIEWQEITVNVVATSTLTRLQFTDLGTPNSLGTFVDAFRLYSEVCN